MEDDFRENDVSWIGDLFQGLFSRGFKITFHKRFSWTGYDVAKDEAKHKEEQKDDNGLDRKSSS